MALMQIQLMSRSLMRTVPVTVVLPADKVTDFDAPLPPETPFPTLYLLHGILGSSLDWLSGTRIERFATERDLCVVMPAGDNSFYVDRPGANQNYGEFVGRELVELTRRMLPLSRRRQDTFIGGLSMGGYGALRNGLKYHDTFGAIIALSSGLRTGSMASWDDSSPAFMSRRSFAEGCFGDLDALTRTDMHPPYLLEQLAAQGCRLPAVYMACGDSDELLPDNLAFADALRRHGADLTWVQGPGGHDWDFWDTYIRKALDWLPLTRGGTGINSGHIRA